MSTALRFASTPYSPMAKSAALSTWKCASSINRALRCLRTRMTAPISATSSTSEATSNGTAHCANSVSPNASKPTPCRTGSPSWPVRVLVLVANTEATSSPKHAEGHNCRDGPLAIVGNALEVLDACLASARRV